MAVLIQKKISISSEQKKFLESYKQWGFTDQSSIVREALARYINDLEKSRRKIQMAQKAKELVFEYATDRELMKYQ